MKMFSVLLMIVAVMAFVLEGASVTCIISFIVGCGLLAMNFFFKRKGGSRYKKSIQTGIVILAFTAIIFSSSLSMDENTKRMKKIVRQSADEIGRMNYDKAEDMLINSGALYEEIEIFQNLLALYIVSERYEEAGKMIEKTPKSFDLNSNACFNAGMLYYLTQDYKKSLEYFEKAVFKSPEFYDAYIFAGRCLMKYDSDIRRNQAETSLLSDARFFFRSAVRIDSKRFDAHLYLAENYLLKMDYEKALYHLSEAEKKTDSREVKSVIDEMKDKASYYMKEGAIS